jgi:twitching motility protein PilT
MVNFFPPHQHTQIRLLLAGTLQAIVSQRLLTRSDDGGRHPACEVLVASRAVRECIMSESKTGDIIELIETGGTAYGMQSFDQAIMKAYRTGVISYEEALKNATNTDDFDLRVKGITGASDSWSDDKHDVNSDTAETPISQDVPGMQKF